MSDENPAGDRQDPADQYKTDTAVETEAQSEPIDEVSAMENQPGYHGGDAPESEANDIKGDPDDAVSVDVTKPPADVENPIVTIGGDNYTVDPEQGYRLV